MDNAFSATAPAMETSLPRDIDRSSTGHRVEAWNEWDPLEEVVVGRVDGACFSPTEPGYRAEIRDPALARTIPWPRGPKHPGVIDAANRQLDHLAAVLDAEGVSVRRPAAIEWDQPLRTPTFEVENMYCTGCPRDVMITIGHEVIEATMSRRARYFEHLAYRPIVYELFNADPRMAWTSAPKPTMGDGMYRMEFWDYSDEERHARMHDFEFAVTQDEVLFDAADITRCGRDLFVQESMTTNRPGIAWLKRHLEPRGLRVHPVHFPYDLFPSHIDCTFVPLRPGLVLTNPERPILDSEAALFKANGWRFVDAPQPVSTNDEMPAFCQSSKWLAMNLLSLSPTTVVVEAGEKPLIRMMKGLGFHVIDLPFRDVFEFGGSLHCATWDVRRRGACESYFPSLD
jgi:glycine amidinotransferase